MNYLLDTHVIIWAASNHDELSDTARSIIIDPGSTKYVSIVSVWETAIKLETSKLNIVGGLPEFYRMIDDNGFIQLNIERAYADCLMRLPMIHRDPFDRMLIATAIAEGLTLVTIDGNIQKYDMRQIW
jgi:PIN domain nuclease of toxin-antitoxin system